MSPIVDWIKHNPILLLVLFYIAINAVWNTWVSDRLETLELKQHLLELTGRPHKDNGQATENLAVKQMRKNAAPNSDLP